MSEPNPGGDPVTALMREGRWDEAEAALRTRLAAAPGDARVLRLLGTVCHLTARAGEALDLLERALAIEPGNVSTLLNLGGVHLAADRLDAAQGCFARAVEVDAGSANAWFNLGVAAHRAGSGERAREAYGRALAIDATLVDAAVNLAVLELAAGNREASLAASTRALAAAPGHPAAFALALRALTALERIEDGDRLLASAPAALVDRPEIQALAGKLRFVAGRLGEAAASYRRARELGDERLDTAMDLARCLLESGDADGAAAVMRGAAAREPGNAACQALLGLACLDAERHDEALAAYDAAVAIEPGNADHQSMRAQVLFALGRDAQAETAVDAAIEAAPAVVSPHLLRVEQRIARGDLAGALSACEDYLSHQGLECSLLAARGFLLHALGRSEEGARLMDHDRLVQSWMIEAPEGYADVAAFNAALARHIRAHPSLSRDTAASRATQLGRQSGNLFFGDKGPFAAFESLLWRAARRYVERVGRDPAHPFLARPPALGAVYCWAVVLERSGYQSPHIHPTAWLSGVYYPELPALVRESDSEQGWIEFGAPPPELAMQPAAPTRRLRPREGLIVLFPSYFYHRTVPYESDEQRISIAFDFSPRRGG